MSLYNKYRPQSFEQIRGNVEMIRSLQSMFSDRANLPHAFLLHGETGCGKTTVARIIAKELGCEGSDYREVDSADFRGIDTIREIRKNSQYQAMESKCRVWVLDECHMLSKDAQNALLKILEDTPKHVYFVLCTTDPQKLIPTVKGRCSQFQVNLLSDVQMQKLLQRIVRYEKQHMSQEVYDAIIKESNGRPRNAIVTLEQVLHVPEEDQLVMAQQGALIEGKSIDLCRALFRRAPWSEVKLILTALKEQEPETIRRAVLGYCQAVLLKSDNVLAGRVLEEFIDPFYNSGFPQLVYACYSITKN